MTQEDSQTETGEVLLAPFDLLEETSTRAKTAETFLELLGARVRNPNTRSAYRHQRLDVSYNDDRCRVRNDNTMLVLAMMLRLSNSLFMQWSGYQRRPDHVTTTDFQSALSEDHHRPALRLALSKYPNLKRLS